MITRMKQYTVRMRINTKFKGFLEILTGIVKFGELSMLKKNLHIGLFGHTLNLKGGVKE
jgi:hypothetical protein